MSIRELLTDEHRASVLAALEDAPASVPTISRRAGLPPGLVKAVLRQARSVGLAAKTGERDERDHKLWGLNGGAS